jgi:hypothetical protein
MPSGAGISSSIDAEIMRLSTPRTKRDVMHLQVPIAWAFSASFWS